MPKKAVERQIKREYGWNQYTDDVEHGLFTVHEIVKRDIAKTFSESEAKAMVMKLNREANS